MENLKEYLRKNNDGEYILEVTDEREAQEPHAKHWIEVPKGCDYLISAFGVNSFIDSDVFAKVKPKNVLWSRKPMKEYLNKETYEYKKSVDMGGHSKWIEIPEGAEKATLCNGYLIFWKNEVESFSEKDGDESWASGGDNMSFSEYMATHDDISIVWQRHTHPEELPFIDDEPSLNDQYAEIEKVRQSHRTASETSSPTIKETLNQRQSQYGSFEDVAMITEQMVDVMRKGYYENLAYNQKMALYMICSKMARIVNGDPNHKDSWHDIAGYATLIDNELESEKDMPF